MNTIQSLEGEVSGPPRSRSERYFRAAVLQSQIPTDIRNWDSSAFRGMSVGKHGLVIRAVYGVDVTDPSEPIVLAETPIPELHQDQAIELEAADTEPESEIVENPEGGFDLVVGGQVVDHSDYLYLGCFSGKNDGEGTETTPAS